MRARDGENSKTPEGGARPGEGLLSFFNNFSAPSRNSAVGENRYCTVDYNEVIDDPGAAKTAVEQLAARLRRAGGGDGELAASARALPLLLADRRAAVDATLRLAAGDRDFRRLVAIADTARDHREWSVGEYNYWLGLKLYPLHSGYIVQYAHCIREQNKFLEAEIQYRNALALGEKAEMRHYITACCTERGAQVSAENLDAVFSASSGAWSRPFDFPPTSKNVQDLYDLLLGRGANFIEIADIMNLCPSILEVALRLCQSKEFRAANRRVLSLIAGVEEAPNG